LNSDEQLFLKALLRLRIGCAAIGEAAPRASFIRQLRVIVSWSQAQVVPFF
jgi:hypothetical protein